jgi:hypothetical protein
MYVLKGGVAGKYLGGVMVRLRGAGRVVVTLEPDTPGADALSVGEIRAGSEFSEVLAGGATPFSGFVLNDASSHVAISADPSALALRTEDGTVEIDCVVPYLTP